MTPAKELDISRLDASAELDALVGSSSAEHAHGAVADAIRLGLAAALRKARRDAGDSQAALARDLAVSQSWVSKMESSDHEHAVESVTRFLHHYGMTLVVSVQRRDGAAVWTSANDAAARWAYERAGFRVPALSAPPFEYAPAEHACGEFDRLALRVVDRPNSALAAGAVAHMHYHVAARDPFERCRVYAEEDYKHAS